MKVGFIGAGKMAEAIISSLISSKTLGAHEICACEINADRRRLLKRRHGINLYSKLDMAIRSDVVILAVKPQDLDGVLRDVALDIGKNQLVISIIAGKKISYIESVLLDAKVVRVMPNLATLVSEGMSVFCKGATVKAADKKTVVKLLSCFGKVLDLPEEQFDIVTALSGSGPAFFAYILNSMVDVAIDAGMKRQDALLLAEQTMLGTSKILIDKKIDPVDLMKSVASAKGTTEAGLNVLKDSSIAKILTDTLNAAAKRSEELSA